jgi:hypothetical protein
MRALLSLVLLALLAPLASAAVPPAYLWFEPEWFEGVRGSFAYWTGEAKPQGAWGIAGPGISPEWTQGGESEWNSMGAPAEETKASCQRDFVVPRSGKYHVWVRYVDHRKKTEPFRAVVEQNGKPALSGELGLQPVVPANDELQLVWGFSFGWGQLTATLEKGPARLLLVIDKAGEAWRQVDAVLLTDDLAFIPHGREKPRFAYQASFDLHPADGATWRGNPKEITPAWKRPPHAGKDFALWTGVGTDKKWWDAQKIDTLSLHDVFFQFSPPADIREQFHKQYAGKQRAPLISSPLLLPGLYLGETPDLSPETPLRKWLERTKTPFYILTNYASGVYTDKNGPATYAALTGPLAGQFLGYIHGEAIGTGGVGGLPDKPLAATRREHLDLFGKQLVQKQADAWSKIYKTTVAPTHFNKGISCLSVDSIALAHEFAELGAEVLGYEEDSTNVHVPMRIAFVRGAARQYGVKWINYASGNFGDACNYFSQEPQVPRGAKGWFHSRYAITDGVTATWYRKLYYLNHLGGASAVYWEQSLANQWILPGPGKHPIQLSPFGRTTEDFMDFATRLPDRGEPYTPVAVLLSHGHGYERVNYHCKMLGAFREDKNDLELRELFNVFWHPSSVVEGLPAAPDVQSMPSGVYGNSFDIFVDRPKRLQALANYPVVWAAGDVDLGPCLPALEDHLKRGGTLVVNVQSASQVGEKLLGVRVLAKTTVAEEWAPVGGEARASTPYQVVGAELIGASVLAWASPKTPLVTRHAVGNGAVILTLAPRLLGQDERAHPVLPYLVNGIMQDLLPVQVRKADGGFLGGEVMYQVNKTKDGWLVLLVNNQGIDKTPNGVARVDRRAHVDVQIRTPLKVQSAREYTEPRDLQTTPDKESSVIRLRVHPGDVQVVGLVVR